MTAKEVNKKFERMSRQAANAMSVDGTRPTAPPAKKPTKSTPKPKGKK